LIVDDDELNYGDRETAPNDIRVGPEFRLCLLTNVLTA
jgi:hypothetical protein